METNQETHYMQLALEQAETAREQGEVPVGAVVVDGDRVIGAGHNGVIRTSDPCAHAEVVALRAAGETRKNYRLTGSDMYVTLEPCLMCYSAMVHARIKTLYYGADDPKTGVFSTGAFDGVSHVYNHDIQVKRGIRRAQASSLLTDFFKERRGAGAVERGGLENRCGE